MVHLIHLVVLHDTQIEIDLIEGYLLVHPRFDPHLLDVVLLVWRVHHSRHVVHVSLLGHAGVNAQVGITEGIYLQGDLELILRRNFLSWITQRECLRF